MASSDFGFISCLNNFSRSGITASEYPSGWRALCVRSHDFRSDGLKKVIPLEHTSGDKGRGSNKRQARIDLLTRYLKYVRNDREDGQPLYGFVILGRCCRSFQLDSSQQECVDYSGTDGKQSKLAGDETEIHTMLSELPQHLLPAALGDSGCY